jgi:hypothetical protein
MKNTPNDAPFISSFQSKLNDLIVKEHDILRKELIGKDVIWWPDFYNFPEFKLKGKIKYIGIVIRDSCVNIRYTILSENKEYISDKYRVEFI